MTSRPASERRVLVTVKISRDAVRQQQQKFADAGLDVFYSAVPSRYSAEEVASCWGIIAGDEPYPAAIFEQNTGLTVISRTGAGYDNVDLDAASRCGCAICVAPGANRIAVAEHAMGLMLALARGTLRLDRQVHAGQWQRPVFRGLHGSTLGILGLGAIGTQVARLARHFGMHMLANDILPLDALAGELGVELVDFEELLSRCDILTLHVPLTALTTNIINARSLALMRRGSLLVNTSRGGTVDELALLAALNSGQVAGAALDVFQNEPPGASKLLQLDTVICTPHIAGVELHAIEALARSAVDNLLQVAAGRPVQACVNKAALRPIA